MEGRKQGETLELLDPASLPTTPDRAEAAAWSSRSAPASGLLLGLVIAAAREMKDTSLKNLKDVRAYTQMAILGSVPLLENDFVVRRRRRLAWLGWTTACLAAVVVDVRIGRLLLRDESVVASGGNLDMSRVHDALRRAEQSGTLCPHAGRPPRRRGGRRPIAVDAGPNLSGLLDQVEEVPFRAATDSLLIDVTRPHEAPMEEFRTLRTRLNHMKSLQPIHTVVVTSASPAEGKSLTAANLALARGAPGRAT